MDVDDDRLKHMPKDPDGDGFWAVIIWTIIAVIAVLLLAAYAPLRGV